MKTPPHSGTVIDKNEEIIRYICYKCGYTWLQTIKKGNSGAVMCFRCGHRHLTKKMKI